MAAGARAEMSIDASRTHRSPWHVGRVKLRNTPTRYMYKFMRMQSLSAAAPPHTIFISSGWMLYVKELLARPFARLQPPPRSNKMFRREANGLSFCVLARAVSSSLLFYIFLKLTPRVRRYELLCAESLANRPPGDNCTRWEAPGCPILVADCILTFFLHQSKHQHSKVQRSGVDSAFVFLHSRDDFATNSFWFHRSNFYFVQDLRSH